MKEELAAITERLDVMQGMLIAQQAFLVAIAQDLQRKDWSFLLEKDGLLEQYLDQMRYSSASDLTMSAFQQSLSELAAKLNESVPETPPF